MTDAEIRRKRFEDAKAAREKAEKERKSSGFGGPLEIPDFEYLELKQDKCQVFRMVGESLEQRKLPSDPLLVERGLMRADDDSYFTCIWHPDKDWPLRVLARKLGKYKYDPKTKQKTYDNADCSFLQRWNTNGKDKPTAYETGMTPKKYVLANAIDRMDDWCKENKHTKMLAWDSTTKDDKTYYQAGISNGLYKYIFDNKCTNIGSHYEDVDFVVRRFSEKTRPSDDTYYLVMHYEEMKAIGNWSAKDKVDYASFINKEDYLSDEELAYERYNLENIPFISQPTPIGIIMNKLGKFIKGIDAKYGWDLWSLFVEWKEKEVEAANATKAEKEANTEKKHTHVEEQEQDEDLPSEVETKVTKVKKVVKEESKDFSEDDYNTFEGLAKLEEAEKAAIVSVDSEEMTIKFNVKADVECPTCSKDFPEFFNTCPYCGEEF
jgi:hypothetical protein